MYVRKQRYNVATGWQSECKYKNKQKKKEMQILKNSYTPDNVFLFFLFYLNLFSSSFFVLFTVMLFKLCAK